ncbi:zeta toxin family protein [Streptomyces sp. NPDC014733]|uniref:zeta toxin family protein n=1 Tax=Streptomyces sp. NPDC014733 TaxID=3364885 RepID=UPI0036FDB8A1
MDPEKVAAHRRALEEAGRDGRLDLDAPTATIRNPQWFVHIDGRPQPTAARTRTHRELLNAWQAETPEPGRDRIAVITAGPSGAGKSSVLPDVCQRLSPEPWRQIDPDEMKDRLLQQAMRDGSYAQLVPEGMGEPGERFYPRELAALVHEESSLLSKQAQGQAIADGENVVIDGTLANGEKAHRLAETLQQQGYQIHVVDVEAPEHVARERVVGRWQGPYEQIEARAELGQDVSGELGGRWVPGEVLDPMYANGPERTVCADNAEALIERHEAVRGLDRYVTPHMTAAPQHTESWQRDGSGQITHRTYEAEQPRSVPQQRDAPAQDDREQARPERGEDGRSPGVQHKLDQLRARMAGRQPLPSSNSPQAPRPSRSNPERPASRDRAEPTRERDEQRRARDRDRGPER